MAVPMGQSGRKKKVLILEDSEARRRVFRENLGSDCDLSFFDRVEDAERALIEEGPFDLIFLDHDLDGRVFVSSDEANTGYQLAKFIARERVKPRIVIHSMNIDGAARMRELLPEAEYIEFPELFEENGGF
jgi:CheY-like chemotaxis protein